ncbi:hypothetical protein M422DRAFT_264146 [Sphaerobolus stellatus SS14]|uniref:Uncharacterized protein n=1 Tax=Sphaerobolus stellatus (strain SS14) TaxID=990650 RepID=A0A0C9V8T0_SPHS4|nr:hypothetical protein M422DRAFT_264146 [Sphaerobolus stellatus SS14]
MEDNRKRWRCVLELLSAIIPQVPLLIQQHIPDINDSPLLPEILWVSGIRHGYRTYERSLRILQDMVILPDVELNYHRLWSFYEAFDSHVTLDANDINWMLDLLIGEGLQPLDRPSVLFGLGIVKWTEMEFRELDNRYINLLISSLGVSDPPYVREVTLQATWSCRHQLASIQDGPVRTSLISALLVAATPAQGLLGVGTALSLLSFNQIPL